MRAVKLLGSFSFVLFLLFRFPLVCLFDCFSGQLYFGLGRICLVRMECPAWCSGGRRPLIAGCRSLQSLGVALPVTRPVWDSNLGTPHLRTDTLPTKLSERTSRARTSRLCWPVCRSCGPVQREESASLTPSRKSREHRERR